MYRNLLLCSLLFLLTHCAPHLSSYFDSTHYVESYNTHIINDSLQLHLKTGADVRFLDNKNKIEDLVKRQGYHPGGLLAYGKTEIAPHYEIFLWLDPKKSIEAKRANEAVHDTLIRDQKLVLLCNSSGDSNSGSFRNDCENIFNSITVGENYRKKLSSVFDISKKFSNSYKYYEAMNKILSYPAKNRNQKWLKLQLALNFASFLAPNDAYDSLLVKFEQQNRKNSTEKFIRNHAIQGKDQVFEKIMNTAENSRMVMFNENHFFPNHRILLKELLPKLKEKGFDYLALEALGPQQDSLLNAGNKPTLDTGFYTREQHFAELIRTGQELGFTFVGYENFNREKNREQGQAKNLYDKTFGKDNSAKVVVLAGMDHILEQPTQKGKSWLGHLLHEQYELDPLTISQSHLNRYRRLAEPVALLQGNDLQRFPYHSVDFLLLNNLPLQSGNYNFTFTNTAEKKVQAAVFLESETEGQKQHTGAIPYRTELIEPDGIFSAYLPKGQHYLVLFDKNGNILTEKQIRPTHD